MCTPEYMAEFTKHFLEAGVQFVGGCCGTTPLHIKAMAQAFRHQGAMRKSEHQGQSAEFSKIEYSDPKGKAVTACTPVAAGKKNPAGRQRLLGAAR